MLIADADKEDKLKMHCDADADADAEDMLTKHWETLSTGQYVWVRSTVPGSSPESVSN